MSRVFALVVLGLLAVASARPVAKVAPGPQVAKVAPAPQVALNITGVTNSTNTTSIPANSTQATIQPRKCCGFLCLGTCPVSYVATFTCRCARGCKHLYATLYLPYNVDPGFCTNRNVYNAGGLCSQAFSLKFNQVYKVQANIGENVRIKGGGSGIRWNFSNGGAAMTC